MDCPVCGEFYFSELDESDVEIYDNLQCPQCGWIYDLEQVEDPKATTSLNGTSLTDYREKYKALIKENPEYNYCDDHYEAVPHEQTGPSRCGGRFRVRAQVSVLSAGCRDREATQHASAPVGIRPDRARLPVGIHREAVF